MKISATLIDPVHYLDITEPTMAYILGLLWADGWLQDNKISIQLVEEDMKDVENIFFGLNKWNIMRVNGKGKRRNQRGLNMSDARFASFLREHGYETKATGSACKILSRIPAHLKHFWFRGLFDGDGCFYAQNRGPSRHGQVQNMFISSAYAQDWTYMVALTTQLGISYSLRRIKRKQQKHEDFKKEWSLSSVFEIKKLPDCKILGEYLYSGYECDKIGLTRKHKKWSIIKARTPRRGKAGFLGVQIHPKTGKYCAVIHTKTFRKQISTFNTAEEAARSYDQMAIEAYGINAKTNISLNLLTPNDGHSCGSVAHP